MTENAIESIKENTPIVYDDKIFEEVTQTGDYLHRLQLMTSNSEVCKSGEFPINHFALVKDQNYKDLGTEVNLLVIAWRPKALQTGEEIISVYNTSDPMFNHIKELSAEQNSGCMFGPEFLVWIGSINQFATFFMGTKSMRREALTVREYLEKTVTLKPNKISTSKFTWYSPKAERCTALFELPKPEDLEPVLEKFLNPPAVTTEIVSEEEKSDRAR